MRRSRREFPIGRYRFDLLAKSRSCRRGRDDPRRFIIKFSIGIRAVVDPDAYPLSDCVSIITNNTHRHNIYDVYLPIRIPITLCERLMKFWTRVGGTPRPKYRRLDNIIIMFLYNNL